MSVLSTVGSEVYLRSLRKTKEATKKAKAMAAAITDARGWQTRVQGSPGRTSAANQSSAPPTTRLAEPQDERTRRIGPLGDERTRYIAAPGDDRTRRIGPLGRSRRATSPPRAASSRPSTSVRSRPGSRMRPSRTNGAG
ncbi:hypothetical protein ACFSVJ_19910 [Prauserella oleivorans]